jgi:hypothetical protein
MLENIIATLDQFNTAVFLKNPEGRYLSMNRMGIQLMQKGQDGVLGRSAFDLFDLNTATQMVESDQHVINSSRIHTQSFDAKDRQTDAPLHIFTAKSPIISPSGEALGTVGISIVNYKNSELFYETCKLLPKFINYKYSNIIKELVHTRTIAEFFNIH